LIVTVAGGRLNVPLNAPFARSTPPVKDPGGTVTFMPVLAI